MLGAFDPARMLEVLVRHQVDFVVIGGFAAWLQGAPIVTVDLDLVFDHDPGNVRRLVAALRELRAIYRDPAGRRIEPDEGKLASRAGAGHHLLRTDAGDLDVLREAAGVGYRDLSSTAIEFEIEGLKVRLASLRQIIELKERAGRPKDLAALPTLRAALEDGGNHPPADREGDGGD